MQLHPLNKNFVWRQPSPPYHIITEAQARAYRELGGFVLEDAFSAAEIEAVVQDLDPIEVEANAQLGNLAEGQPTISRPDEIVFSPHIVLKSDTARQFAQHAVFKALCHDLIGDAVRLYWDQLVYKRPGTEEEFPWHQDNGYNFVSPQQYLTCWVALTDATIDNGCPWIAPGLQRHGTLAHRWTELGFTCLDESPGDARAMPLRAGSVAVFSSLTPHRTGANLSTNIRKAYILQYAPDGAMIHPRQGQPFGADDEARQFYVVGP